MTVSDEPSNGELGRLIQSMRVDMRDDLSQLNARLDRVVPMDVYTIEKNALNDRIGALEQQREKDTEKLIATRRWLIGAVIVPLVGVLLPVVIMLARGTGS